MARQWMKEQGISCMALSVEFIYIFSGLSRSPVNERTRNILNEGVSEIKP